MHTSVLVIKQLPLSSKPACEAGAGDSAISALSSDCYWGSANRGRSREMTRLDQRRRDLGSSSKLPFMIPDSALCFSGPSGESASYPDFLCINSVCPRLPFPVHQCLSTDFLYNILPVKVTEVILFCFPNWSNIFLFVKFFLPLLHAVKGLPTVSYLHKN